MLNVILGAFCVGWIKEVLTGVTGATAGDEVILSKIFGWLGTGLIRDADWKVGLCTGSLDL